MRHLGDYAPATVLYFMFTTYRPSTGAAYTLAGTPVVRVYKNGSTTQHTTTYSVTADFDTITGLNYFTIDTSADGTFYAAGGQFTCVLEAGTVDSVSVVGTVVGTFTLNATSALRPTTAGRTLDVSAGGEAGVDWANVGSPTTVVGLTGTTVKTATDVETDTADIQTRLPAALVSGRIDASVGAMAAGVVTAASIAAAALNGKGDWNIGKTGYSLSAAQTFDLTGSITGNLSGSVGSVTGAVGSVTGAVGSVTGLTASDVAAIKAKTDSLTFTLAGQVDSNVLAIDGVTDAADRLQKVAQGNVFGTCDAGSSTTSIVTSALSPAAAVIDQYKGRILTFKNDTTTANLRGQSTDITASTALGVLTVTALTTAPASGDVFTIS